MTFEEGNAYSASNEKVNGYKHAPPILSLEAADELLKKVNTPVDVRLVTVSYEERKTVIGPEHTWGNSALSKYAVEVETKERQGWYVDGEEVNPIDAQNLLAALEALSAAPVLVEQITALKNRPGWKYVALERAAEGKNDLDLNLLEDAQAALSHPRDVGIRIERLVANTKRILQDLDELLPKLDALEARRSEGALPYFGGRVKTTQKPGRAAFWVVTSEGELRDPDIVLSSKGNGQGENSNYWRCVEPEELALEWNKSSNASPHDFAVIKLPVTQLTPAQLQTVGVLEASLEQEWMGKRGMNSKEPSPSVGEGWELHAPRPSQRKSEAETNPVPEQVIEDAPATPGSMEDKLAALSEKFGKP